MRCCQYASLSSFHTILPYLVQITISWSVSFYQHSCSLISFFHWSYVCYFLHFSKIIVQFCVQCCCVVLFMTGPLFISTLLLLAPGCFSSWDKMLSNGSVLICLCSWSQRYCSAEICVGSMCCLFHVTSLPVSVMQMQYDLSWWFWLPFPSIVPWVHSPPSSHWTITVDSMGIKT